MDAPRPKPNILWRLLLLGGLGTSIAVSVDDGAWDAFDDATGGTVSRDAVRAMTAATLGLHLLEAMTAWRRARKAGLDKPGKWFRATLMWGFPVLLRLRKARRAVAAGEAAGEAAAEPAVA